MIKKTCKHYHHSGCKIHPEDVLIICDVCPDYEEKRLEDINIGRTPTVTKEEVATLLSDMKVTTNNATVTMDEVRSGLEAAKLSKEDYLEAIYQIQQAGGLM